MPQPVFRQMLIEVCRLQPVSSGFGVWLKKTCNDGHKPLDVAQSSIIQLKGDISIWIALFSLIRFSLIRQSSERDRRFAH